MTFNLDQERALFSLCLEHPPEERERVLDAECDDPALRERVRELLRHHRDVTHDDAGFLQLERRDPERIGPYRILQRLGEGGMGIVYAAEQREPVRRRVAVKVLREGYNSREVLARFEIERQALALMNHPNIARIFDAGTTADRRPYIVMEFVPGEPVTRYCENRKLPLRARLELFATLCEAVQHAHQKGVIHRDLKPSNMLVMEEDGRPVAKIIDFGIAKAVSQRLTEYTLETRVGSLIGTPDYMSPEQAESSTLDVDTRSDVYALGAVLYQLLAGEAPLLLAGSGKSYVEMQREILERQPVPPSRRGNEAMQRKLRGDLDWITMKALEKQRARRYATAADLAADLRAHLAGRTVLAGPPSQWRKVDRFLRRHWLASAATLAVIATLSFSQMMLIAKNRELEAERDRANREALVASKVTQFTADLFKFASPGVSGAGDMTARDLLDAAVRQLDNAGESPEVKAALLQAAAAAYRDLGVFEDAERLLDRAMELQADLHGVQSPAYAAALLDLSRIQHASGRGQEAEATARRVLAMTDAREDPLLRLSVQVQLGHILFRQGRYDAAASMLTAVIERGAGIPAATHDIAYATSVLGRVRHKQGRFEDAETLLRDSIDQARDPDAGSRGTRAQLVRDSQSALAGLYADQGRFDEAVRLLRDMLAQAVALYGEDHPEAATMMNNLGRTLSRTGDNTQEAEELLQRAASIYTTALGADNRMTLIARDNLSSLYIRTEQWEKAIAIDRDVLAMRRNSFGENHIDTAYSQASLARSLAHTGELEQAAALLGNVANVYGDHYGEESWACALVRREYGQVLAKLGRREAALRELEKARHTFLTLRGPGSDETRALDTLIANLRRTSN